MKQHRALIATAALGLLIVVAAGLEGVGQFTGLRLNLSVPIPTQSAPQQAQGSVIPRPTASPSTAHSPNALPAVLAWIAISAVIAVLVIAIVLWLRRRNNGSLGLREAGALSTAVVQEATPAPDEAPQDDPEVRRAIDVALAALDAERQPGDAVVQAWLGLQETAEESGISRGAAETATDFTARVLGRISTDDRAVRTLLNLYLRARFGQHPVTTDDVARARAALVSLAQSWDDHAMSAVLARGALRPAPGTSVSSQRWPTE